MAQEKQPTSNLVLLKRLEIEAVRKYVRQGRLDRGYLEQKETEFKELVGEAQPPAVVPEAPKLVPEAAEAGPIALPETLTPIGYRIAQHLRAEASAENPIASSDIVRFLYGDGLDLKVGRERVAVYIPRINKELKDVGLRIVNTVPRIAGAKGEVARYYLAPIKKPAEEKVEEVEGKLPIIVVNQQDKEATVNGKTIGFSNEVRWNVFVSLARNLKDGLSSPEMAAVAIKSGYQTNYPARDIVAILNDLFKKAGQPRLIERTGPSFHSVYRLNAQVEFVGESERAKKFRKTHEVVEVTLPDGQAIQLKGKVRSSVLTILCGRSAKNPISVKRLATEAKTTVHGVDNVIFFLRRELTPLSWKIVQAVAHPGGRGGVKGKGVEGLYYLAKKAELTEGEKK